MAGELLKKKREELGLDLKEISALLKIREDYLSWIEEDCFDRLPVAVYTIGYIRCYANYLTIEPEPIIATYTGHLTEPKPSTVFPIASSRRKIPFSYYVIPVLVLILVFLVVFIMRQGKTVPVKVIPVAPVQPVQTESVKPQQQQSAMPQTVPQPVQPAVNSQAAVSRPSQISGSHSLEITAKDMTWMHLKFADGKYEEAMLRPGMSRTWQFTGKAVLKLGNAGGIRIKLDNRDLGAPGSNGQVITLILPENRLISPQDQ